MGTILNLSDVQRSKSEKGDEYGAAVVELFMQECDPATMLSFKTLGTLETKHRRTNSIPTVGFRQGRGTSFGSVSGVGYDQVTDSVYSLGAQIEMDKADIRDKDAGDLLGERTRMAVKGMAWTFLDYFINGDHATDPHGFEGIKVRLANSPSGQIVYGVDSSNELDVRASASPSEATLYTFLDKIDETIDTLDGHDGDVVYTSSDFIATLRSVLRRLGKYTAQPESEPGKFGDNRRRTTSEKTNKPVLVYPQERGLRWFDMGYKSDGSTRVVGTDTVNSVACRPAYFCKLGMPYLHGIQQYAMEVTEPRWLDDQVTQRVTVDWPVGLHMVHNKSLAVLKGVRVA